MSISESIPADLSKRHRRKGSSTPSVAISRTSLSSGELSLTDTLMYLWIAITTPFHCLACFFPHVIFFSWFFFFLELLRISLVLGQTTFVILDQRCRTSINSELYWQMQFGREKGGSLDGILWGGLRGEMDVL